MLRGARYIRPGSASLVRFIADDLRSLDLDETRAFYDAFERSMPEPEDRALLACNDRFYLLTRMCGRRDAEHPWLFARCREVEASPDGHLDLWARFHYKSTIITFAGILQEVLIDPELTVGIFSFSRSTAQGFLRQIKTELETNEGLRTSFPDVLWYDPGREAGKWSEGDGLLLKRHGNPKEMTIEAWGLVEGQPTSRHFQLLVFDDMIEARNATNAEQIKRATLAWELSMNLGTHTGSRRWYIGTRYLLGDTYQTMLDRKAVKKRIYPATDNGRENGSPIFLSPAVWHEMRITQRSTLAAQMLQNPAAGNQSSFQIAWNRGYDVRPATLNVYIMGDPSRGRTAKSDRTAIAVVGIDAAGNKYLLDGVRHRMTLSQRWEALFMLRQKWHLHPGVQMVRVGYERYGQQSDDEYFQEQMRKLKHEDEVFAIEELAWPSEGSNSKIHRVERLQPDLERGKFFLPALIRHPEFGECYWRFSPDDDKIEYTPAKAPTRTMRAMTALGQQHRCCEAIVRRDETGRIYDLAYSFIEEMGVFPFGQHDDLVDAVSRVYDMQPMPPTVFDKLSTEVVAYPDA